ncbi:PREDICTED: origin recognition complex subunit 4-like [Branchiostoma belcheri]|uniref:Origin recognition complex subunit 4 n=1 Tax=Branchiostoma belcheri TaxID=7741 RepID=A0A6P4XS81_BRABE|nr:PREDICTED: origin recognition complex subunit 4-like [Branchiostoma belcheri]
MSKRKSTGLTVVSESASYAELQKILRERIYKISAPEEIDEDSDLEKPRRHLLDLIQRCSSMGESNSALIIGPRGAGKTMLLKSVLDELKENRDFRDNVLEVHLNGLLQTDDRIALKEITRQLQLENAVGDRVFGSFADNLAFLLEALKKGSRDSQAVLFVLEEFDLFAHHKNQTLLYNLFDVAQSQQAPITVIGLTCRLDVIELLEKRVKSRFSHRQIHLFNSLTFDRYLEVFSSLLTLPTAEVKDKKFCAKWNKHVQNLSDDPGVTTILRKLYDTSKDIRTLKTFLMLPVARISLSHSRLELADFAEAHKILTADSKSNTLHGLSVLELCLVVAMRRLSDIFVNQPFNFQMVYNEYQKFVQTRSHAVQGFERPVVLKAFEHLQQMELVRAAEGAGIGGRGQKEFRPMTLMIDRSQLMQAIQKYPACPTEVKHWANTL